MRLTFFVLVVVILAALHDTLEVEQRLARSDPLTGLANLRQFTEQAQFELHEHGVPALPSPWQVSTSTTSR